MFCEYCGNKSGVADTRGGCISCGAPLVSNCKEKRSGKLVPNSTVASTLSGGVIDVSYSIAGGAGGSLFTTSDVSEIFFAIGGSGGAGR